MCLAEECDEELDEMLNLVHGGVREHIGCVLEQYIGIERAVVFIIFNCVSKGKMGLGVIPLLSLFRVLLCWFMDMLDSTPPTLHAEPHLDPRIRSHRISFAKISPARPR